MIQAVIERCAGIDVGKKELAVTILTGGADQEPTAATRTFGTTVPALLGLKNWLAEYQVTHVVMESTGSYWKPVFHVLEESVVVWVAHPKAVKNLRGHKTDLKDSHWLAHLLRHGMIRPSFIPPREIRDLRDLTRRRKRLLGHGASERNRVLKLLEDANLKFGSVLSNVFGASGQAILEALLKGEGTPREVAAFARGRLRTKMAEIAEAIEGHQMRDHHRWLIRQCLDHMQFLERQVDALDEEILKRLENCRQEFELLQTIPGIKCDTAAAILAEIGPDMSQFPSEKQLTSWAGICPGNNRSAGKQRSGRTTRGDRWLLGSLVEATWGAINTRDSFFKKRFYRICGRTGRKKAIVALARSLLVAIYHVLQKREPFAAPESQRDPEQQRQRMVRFHCQRLRELGVEVEQPTAEPLPPRPRQCSHKRHKGQLGIRSR